MVNRYGKFTSRTKARKRAADILFEADQKGIVDNQSALLELLQERKKVTAAASPLPQYAQTLVEGVAKNFNQIERLLKQYAKGAGLDRIPAVDLAVMRVAVWELLCNQKEVPPISAIDQAVTIVKGLSTDASPAYVNAVLDAIRKNFHTLEEAPTFVEDTANESSDDMLDDEMLDELLGEY